MNSTFLFLKTAVFEMNSLCGYAIGALLALIILGYLVYALIKPERF